MIDAFDNYFTMITTKTDPEILLRISNTPAGMKVGKKATFCVGLNCIIYLSNTLYSYRILVQHATPIHYYKSGSMTLHFGIQSIVVDLVWTWIIHRYRHFHPHEKRYLTILPAIVY